MIVLEIEFETRNFESKVYVNVENIVLVIYGRFEFFSSFTFETIGEKI